MRRTTHDNALPLMLPSEAGSSPSSISRENSPREERRRVSTVLYLTLVGLGFLARALVFIRPLKYLDGLTIPDDSYYTLTLARSIAHGFGPYTGLAETNGFQPLFGFLMVPSFWIFSDPFSPVRVAVVVSALADTAGLALFGSLLLKQVRDTRVVWLAMFMWAVSPYAIMNATNGLETSLAVCLVLVAASYFPRLRQVTSGARDFFLFGVLGGLAMFARVDAGLLLPVAAFLSVRNLLGRGTIAALRCGAATVAGVFLANLPWWLFSYHYTGRIYPDSGRAVRLISHYWMQHPTLASVYGSELQDGMYVILSYQRPVLAVLLMAALIILLRGGGAALIGCVRALWQQQGILIVFSGALFSAYTMYIFGYWFYYRYFYVISVVVLILTALTLDHALGLLKNGNHHRVILYASTALFIINVVTRHEHQKFDPNSGPRTLASIYLTADPIHRAFMNVGLWAENYFPAGTVIGAQASGAMGYYAKDVKVVNLDGVVNYGAYEALKSQRLFEYARSVNVQYVIVWGGRSFIKKDNLVLERNLDFESLGRSWQVYRFLVR